MSFGKVNDFFRLGGLVRPSLARFQELGRRTQSRLIRFLIFGKGDVGLGI